MKKHLFYFLAATTLVGCSSDEILDNAPVVDNTPQRIEFNAPFVDKSTRAEDTTTENLTAFSVWAYLNNANTTVFSEEVVTKGTNSWTHPTSAYWAKNSTYYFTAVAPTKAGQQWVYTPSTTDVGEGTLDVSGRTLPDDDLVFAKFTKTTGDNITERVVNVTFDHLYSKVRFAFKNSLGSGETSLDIREVVMKQASIAGKYDTKTKTWATTATKADLSFGSTSRKIENTETLYSGSLYLIPVASTTWDVTFTIVTFQSGNESKEYKHTVSVSATLEAGKSYTFLADINGTNLDPTGALIPIEFTPSVNAWTEVTPDIEVTFGSK